MAEELTGQKEALLTIGGALAGCRPGKGMPEGPGALTARRPGVRLRYVSSAVGPTKAASSGAAEPGDEGLGITRNLSQCPR